MSTFRRGRGGSKDGGHRPAGGGGRGVVPDRVAASVPAVAATEAGGLVADALRPDLRTVWTDGGLAGTAEAAP
jgi:hypothetical protein